MMITNSQKSIIRQHINELLLANPNNSLSFQDINQYLLTKGEKVNKTTIYRYLDQLIAENKVQKYSNENGRGSTYILMKSVEDCNTHLHMKCLKCNKIIHLDCNYNQELLDHLKNSNGFEVDCSQTIIYGLCENCSSKK